MGGTRRLLYLSLIALGCAALLIAACGSGGDASPTETPAPSPASSPTGIAEVDAIIDAVERQDVEALLGFVKYQRISCDSPTADGYVIPPTCPEGVSQGTAVDAFLVGGCHPGWVTAGEVADRIGWVGDRQITTFAVLRGGNPFAEITADYRVVLSFLSEPDQSRSSHLGIAGGDVVWLTGWCDPAAQQIASHQRNGAELIYLAPAVSPDVTENRTSPY